MGGMIGNNSCGAHAMAYGTTAANVVALDALDGTGRRLQDREPAQRGGTGARRVRRRAGRADGRRVRPVPPPGVRLLARAPAAVGVTGTWPGLWPEPRAPAASCWARPCRWCRCRPRPRCASSATRTCRPPPTTRPRLDRAARAGARGHRRPPGRRGPRAPRERRGARAARGRGLAVRRGRRRQRGRGAGRGPVAGRVGRGRRLARRPGRPGGGDAVADPRGRRRAGQPHRGGRPGLAGLGGRRRPARAARPVPARVHRAAGRATASTGCSTATSATAACTCGSTSRSPITRSGCGRS